jgi:hypothetical protein
MKRVAALGAAMISTPKGTFILAGLLYTIVFGTLLWPNFPAWTKAFLMSQFLFDVMANIIGVGVGIPAGLVLSRLLARKEQRDRTARLHVCMVIMRGHLHQLHAAIKEVDRWVSYSPTQVPVPIRVPTYGLMELLAYSLELSPSIDERMGRLSHSLSRLVSDCTLLEDALRRLHDIQVMQERGEEFSQDLSATLLERLLEQSPEYKQFIESYITHFRGHRMAAKDEDILLKKLRILHTIRSNDAGLLAKVDAICQITEQIDGSDQPKSKMRGDSSVAILNG